MTNSEHSAEEGQSRGRPAYIYMVECSDGTLYTGWALDVQDRVRVHNAGRGARYTRARRPVTLRYWEEHPNRGTAMRRERKLKRFSRARKLALIAQFQDTQPPAHPQSDAQGGEEQA